MSVNDLPPSADSSISHTSQPYASDLEALDQRLKRLSEDILPLHPYLLTLPTNAPFRLGSRSANNWAVGHDRPFSTEEQQLQYMTFLTHHDGDSLLVAVGDWSDESGHMVDDRPAVTNTTENPRDAVAKKKISLKDYNTQKTSTPGPTSIAPDNQSRPRSATGKRDDSTARATTPDLTKTTDRLDPRPTHLKSQPHVSPRKDPKKRPSMSHIDLTSQIHKPSEMHSPKKARLSPEKEQRMENATARSRSPRLPALLSPTLPPTSGPRLPRLLSPTLPPDIEKELAKIGGQSPVHNPPKRENAAAKSRRSDEVQSRSNNSVNSGTNTNHQVNRTAAGATPPRRIVCLKYGRSNRKRVEALLKFSTKKKAPQMSSTPSADTDLDEVSHAERRREDASHSRHSLASKKVKSMTSTDKPSTPSFHAPTQNKAKPVSLTPVKEHKNIPSRHSEHGDGDGRTPINPANKRYSTDIGARRSPSQPESRSRESDRRAWRDEFQKFSSIGRDLKHASERYTAMTGPSVEDEKLSVVTAIEAILSFILAFVADNQCKILARQVGDSSSWVSILAYWRVVRKRSVSYPILHGLSLLLGAVSYDAIHELDLERLAISPLPTEHTPVPTPGSDNHPAPPDEHKKTWDKFVELKNRLPECYRESQKLWLEGSRILSEDVLNQEFPTTWSGRSHNHADRGRIPLKAGDYVGDYFLPLGGPTQPIEIVRFSWSLLHEWCSQEGVEWHERLVL